MESYKSTIAVGSNSKIKLSAVQDALHDLTKQYNLKSPVNIIGCDAKSNVSEQPIGFKETFKGARNRAQHAQLVHSSADLWIGIENGLFFHGHRWCDTAILYVICKNKVCNVYICDLLIIPNDIMEARYGRGKCWTGLLQQCGTSNNWSQLKDPHSIYGDGRTRKQYITDALCRQTDQ